MGRLHIVSELDTGVFHSVGQRCEALVDGWGLPQSLVEGEASSSQLNIFVAES